MGTPKYCLLLHALQPSEGFNSKLSRLVEVDSLVLLKASRKGVRMDSPHFDALDNWRGIKCTN